MEETELLRCHEPTVITIGVNTSRRRRAGAGWRHPSATDSA